MNLSKTYFSVFSTQNLIFLFTKFEKPDFLLLSWSTIIFPEILVHLYQAELEMKNVIKWIIDHQPFFSFQLLYPQSLKQLDKSFENLLGIKIKLLYQRQVLWKKGLYSYTHCLKFSQNVSSEFFSFDIFLQFLYYQNWPAW